MVKCSNSLIGILNVFSLILSVVILGGGIWLSKHGSTECESFFQKATIAVGVFLLLVSVAGVIGACCGVSWLLWLYLVVMFLLIILLFCFAIFGFVVTNKGAGEALSGKGYKEYRLGDYSNWLQKRVNDNKNWAKIRSCLQDSKICQHLLEDKSADEQAFDRRKLSSLESGCCKPSIDCGFTYANGNWTAGTAPPSDNPDCKAWNNDPARLCYSCQSCKAGFLDNIKSLWKRMAVLIVVVWVILVIIYSVGCCAFRNNRESNAWKHRYP
ncbi:OLC1v1035319C1 [Oldenlandia corymbosa var. corymbosa]|uniref:OLC1v1035319C1 n=1 Tax=Oldenlandia corymbosa var. corymbosa TaxID=529605 RepID=A0AAV1CUH3_OLDCO|nr:OLC1v1035319C1 [Oldenlandia corymbosa var. corymbosa]